MTELAVIDADDAEQRQPPTDSQLKNVRDYAADLYKRKRDIKRLEQEITDHETAIAVLEEKTIPVAMQTIGARSFELDNGFKIEMEDFVHGYVAKENEPAFFKWLDSMNLGSIISHILTIKFGKGDDKWARKFMADLAKRKKPIPVDRKDGIHAQTLKAFFKERFAAEKRGEIPEAKRIPRDIVSVHEGIRAVLFDPAEEAEKAAKRRKAKKSDKVEL